MLPLEMEKVNDLYALVGRLRESLLECISVIERQGRAIEDLQEKVELLIKCNPNYNP